MKNSDYFDWFKEQVKNEMANCRYCMETQPMTIDLAKDMFEVANAMKNNYEAIKAESGKKDINLEALLDTWLDYSRGILENIKSLIGMWNNLNVPNAKTQDNN